MRKSTALLFCLIVSVACIVCACDQDQYIEIHIPEPSRPPVVERAYVGGEVSIPGIYSLYPEDTLQDLVQAAGGLKNDHGAKTGYIIITSDGFLDEPQKVDINRAPSWLLQAIPGIGAVTAEAIIEYRTQHGAFRHIREITNVTGIGQATFDNIAGMITVADLPG